MWFLGILKQGSLNYQSWVNQTMKMYGNFEDFDNNAMFGLVSYNSLLFVGHVLMFSFVFSCMKKNDPKNLRSPPQRKNDGRFLRL